MEFLKSKYFSLVCAIINGAWSLSSLIDGDLVWAIVGACFCALCTKNYFSIHIYGAQPYICMALCQEPPKMTPPLRHVFLRFMPKEPQNERLVSMSVREGVLL